MLLICFTFASILFDIIEFIKLRHRSTEMFSHASLTSSKRVVVFMFFKIAALLTSAHRYSMGFKSVLTEGQSKTSRKMSEKNFLVTFAVCFGTLFR